MEKENKQKILNAICEALRLTSNAGRGNALKEIRYLEDKGSEYAIPIFENGNGEPDEYCPHGYYAINITGDSGTAIFIDITNQFIKKMW